MLNAALSRAHSIAKEDVSQPCSRTGRLSRMASIGIQDSAVLPPTALQIRPTGTLRLSLSIFPKCQATAENLAADLLPDFSHFVGL